jgi:hypothetical protein
VRLYLSSYRVGDRADALRAPVTGARAGIVLNALGAVGAVGAVGATRDRSLPRETDDLERLGYRCEELDLGGYADDMVGLTQRLQELDTVWVVGGNAFVLARAMARTGFREGAAERGRPRRVHLRRLLRGAVTDGHGRLSAVGGDGQCGWGCRSLARSVRRLSVCIHWGIAAGSEHPETAATHQSTPCRAPVSHVGPPAVPRPQLAQVGRGQRSNAANSRHLTWVHPGRPMM